MPKHARLLRELLEEKEAWRSEVQNMFVAVRTDADMSQNAFASTIGISQPYLNQIEHGQRTPSSETLSKLRSYVEGESHGDQDQGQE